MKCLSSFGRCFAALLLLAAVPLFAQAQAGGRRAGTAGMPDASAALCTWLTWATA